MDYKQTLIASCGVALRFQLGYLADKYGPVLRANLPRYGTILGRFVGRLLYRKRRQRN